MNEQLKLTGTIEKIYFRAPGKDLVIGRFRDEESKRKINFRGILPGAEAGQYWSIEGLEVYHPKYGNQIDVSSAEPARKPFSDMLVRYFSSDVFEGVGKKTAQLVVDTLGEDCLLKILADPSVLQSKCKLSESMAQKILTPLSGMKIKASQMSEFLKWGLSQRQISLLEEMPDSYFEQLKDDPFLPYYSQNGFGYEGGVKIANGYALNSNDPRRVEASVLHAISDSCYKTGSTAMDLMDLHYSVNASAEALKQALASLSERGLIHEKDGYVYLMDLYLSESIISSQILLHTYPVEAVDDEVLDNVIHRIEKKANIEYDPLQKQAIKTFFSSSIMILNGGPGTGKSTILLGLLQALQHLYPAEPVTLCAPTGRAAKRMSELANVHASTIHSLLRWQMGADKFVKDESDPLKMKFLIVDEFSMVDSRLFSALLRAVPRDCRILLIGDEDQLESIRPGNVLRDLIESKKIPVVRLETLFRQKEGSGIPLLASEIRQSEPLQFQDPVRFITPENGVVSGIRDLVSREENPEDIQILAPKYDGDSGILAINEMMQELINPFDPKKRQLVTHLSTTSGRRSITYREGDKVILKKNKNDLGIYNGDVGRIVMADLARGALVCEFEGTEAEFEKQDLNEIGHAWCISIHKSQGSEYRKVCVVADENGSGMLKKRLLYTAVSRAKNQLYVIGDETLFRQAVRISDDSRRLTTLGLRLQQAFSKRPSLPEARAESKAEAGSEKTESIDDLFDSNEEFSLE